MLKCQSGYNNMKPKQSYSYLFTHVRSYVSDASLIHNRNSKVRLYSNKIFHSTIFVLPADFFLVSSSQICLICMIDKQSIDSVLISCLISWNESFLGLCMHCWWLISGPLRKPYLYFNSNSLDPLYRRI